jgi:hypothetical protein
VRTSLARADDYIWRPVQLLIMKPGSLSFQIIQAALPGHWHRADGVLSMYIFAPVTAGQKTAVEFTVPTAEGPAVSTWDYEVVSGEGGFWLHLTNRATLAVQTYRIDGLERHSVLRLHSGEGYDLVFHANGREAGK